MKRYTLFALLTLLLLMGCRVSTTSSKELPYISSDAMPIELQFPRGWYTNKKKHPYDLQCFSRSKALTTGIFFHHREDLSKDITTESILKMQVDDLKSKRENFELVEPQKETTLEDKRIISVAYVGEKDGSKYYYRFSCIEFSKEPKDIASVIQVSLPRKWEKSKSILAKICESARYKKEDSTEE